MAHSKVKHKKIKDPPFDTEIDILGYPLYLFFGGMNPEYEKILKKVESRNLVGAANNTKWRELLLLLDEKDIWPLCRYKSIHFEQIICVPTTLGWYPEYISPFVGIEWLDIRMQKNVYRGALINDQIIDHSEWILERIKKIGFEYEVAENIVRIWGYLPKSYDDFPLKGKWHWS